MLMSFDSGAPIQKYRYSLPHWSQDDNTYFYHTPVVRFSSSFPFGWKPNPRSCWKHAGPIADRGLQRLMSSASVLSHDRPIRLEAKSTVMLEACS